MTITCDATLKLDDDDNVILTLDGPGVRMTDNLGYIDETATLFDCPECLQPEYVVMHDAWLTRQANVTN